ncbi:hypothetical protein [Mucilaginibacter sp.]|uniref:hypothetical protein n=1 Tax=Mucilaginibacter sp. TaxID=1882438 RepID=UPI003D0A13B9
MTKYQFCIRFQNTTVNSAATKAVEDCNKIFSELGYIDYTIIVWDNENKFKYYLLLIKELIFFFKSIQKGSIIVIQYPLLSINNVFRYFIKIAKLKRIKIFCIIHDLEALRSGGNNNEANRLEIKNLNYFDEVIVHNPAMLGWMQQHGFKKKAISLEIFDYLSDHPINECEAKYSNSILFAGNLRKSTFIYNVADIKGWIFNVFGPFFNLERSHLIDNLVWLGEYSPAEITTKLTGGFGLIWDGETVNSCDDKLGNYLKYNNPHKFSLYLAAGIPVVAPASSALSVVIKKYGIGFLVENLKELEKFEFSTDQYEEMRKNVLVLREKVINGYFLKAAISKVELDLI